MEKLLLLADRPSRGLEWADRLAVVERLFPELAALNGCPQEPEWHPEGDVWVHTLLCLDRGREECADLRNEQQLTVLLAVLCHDFGKPATTAVVDGRIRSNEHEAAGVAPTHSFLDRLNVHTLGGFDLRDQVAQLVAHHLTPSHFFKNRDRVGDGAFRRLAKKLEPELLYRVSRADCRGRTGDFDLEAQEWFIERVRSLGVEKKPPAPILMGRHLLAMGLQPGPRIGEITRAIYEMQLDGTHHHPRRSRGGGGPDPPEPRSAVAALLSRNRQENARQPWAFSALGTCQRPQTIHVPTRMKKPMPRMANRRVSVRPATILAGSCPLKSGTFPGIPRPRAGFCIITATRPSTSRGSSMSRPGIPRYRILDRLGSGGMGIVYRAEDTRLRRPVALKFLTGECSEREESRARFLQEARTAASLNHPNIYIIHEVGEVETGADFGLEPDHPPFQPGTPFIAMELVEGETLHQILDRDEKLPLPRLMDIACQMAEGLAEAHAHGIVHRDLKPRNVMVTPRGRVRDPGLRTGPPHAPAACGGAGHQRRADSLRGGAGRGEDRGHSRLSFSGAGPGEGSGCPLRPLFLRHNPLRNGHGLPAVPGRRGHRHPGQDPRIGAGADSRRCHRSSGRPGENHPAVPAEKGGGSLRRHP